MSIKFSKTFFILFFLLVLPLSVFVFSTNAQAAENITYKFIERLPFIGPSLTSAGSGTLIVQYLGRVYTLILSVSALLAFFMLIVGGVQYTYIALSPSAKKDAGDRIRNALLGLLIVFGAYLILNTINPDLVRGDLVIQPISERGGAGGDVTTAPLPPNNVVGTPGISVPWSAEQEAARRQQLANLGIRVNKKACGGVRYQSVPGGCTDVANLTDSTITGLGQLKASCNCVVTITGGSEPGHATHGGGRRVDISQNVDSATNNYIRSQPKVSCPDNSRWDAYRVGSGVYCDERVGGDPHWHVVY